MTDFLGSAAQRGRPDDTGYHRSTVRRLSNFFAAPVVALAIVATACGSVSSYAAKVDNKSISQSDLDMLVLTDGVDEAVALMVAAREASS